MLETLLHLGPLHPAERALTIALAFGPFVLLAVTLWITRRRRSHVEDDREETGVGRDVDRDSEGRDT